MNNFVRSFFIWEFKVSVVKSLFVFYVSHKIGMHFCKFTFERMKEMKIDKDELLTKAKELLKDEVTPISFNTWFKSLDIQSISNDHIVFTAVSEFQKDMLENKYNSLLINTLSYITNKNWTFSVVDYLVKTKIQLKLFQKKNQMYQRQNLNLTVQVLNPKYTFETFVVGIIIDLPKQHLLQLVMTLEMLIIHCFYMEGLVLEKPI